MSSRAYRVASCFALAGAVLSVACFVLMPSLVTFVPMLVASAAVAVLASL